MTAAPTTTTTVTAAITAASATATAASTLPLRTRFIYDERAAKKILPVEGCDCFFRRGVVVNLGKPESARLSRETIAKQRE